MIRRENIRKTGKIDGEEEETQDEDDFVEEKPKKGVKRKREVKEGKKPKKVCAWQSAANASEIQKKFKNRGSHG